MEAYIPSSENKGRTIWFTGLSGAGKTTLANKLKDVLKERCYLLDGDIVRKGLNKDLGFSREDRKENIRRISEVAKLFNQAGLTVVVAFISPYIEDRKSARESHQESGQEFYEIFINSSLESCEKRDVKGLYKKARNGEIKNFTGISDPYEVPLNPDLILNTEIYSVDESLEQLLTFINNPRIINEEDCLTVDEEELNILQIIQQGWCDKEITCFFNEEELLECLYFKTYRGKVFQPIPFIFPINNEENALIEKINKSQESKLYLKNKFTNSVIGYIDSPSTYVFRKEEVCSRIFGTFAQNHPKIKKYMESDFLLTGKGIRLFGEIKFNDGLDYLRISPAEIISKKLKSNSDCLYAFQVRNPLHNGHCKLLIESRDKLMNSSYKNPVLLLNPCGGWTKDDDVPLKVRMEQYIELIKDGALPKNTILSIWPSPMFYAGPLEVLWHFKSREYASVDYMIVGRDPAGIKHPINKDIDLYDPTHGAKIIEIAFKNKLFKVKPIPFTPVLYNKKTKEMEFFNILNKDDYSNISGSDLRKIAREGEEIPENFMNEKGWAVLKNYYQNI